MSGSPISAEERNARAAALLNEWLRDESPRDGLRQRLIWKHVREVLGALNGEEEGSDS